MMFKESEIYFVILLVGAVRADYCQDNFTLADFPGGILKQTFSILTTGTILDFLGCPDTVVSPNDVKFWLYNRNYTNNPVLLDSNNLDQVAPDKPFIFLIHGWLCNFTNDKIPELKDAYLKRYDCNVISVDWSALSIDLYTSSFCKAPRVGEIVGNFLCELNDALHVNLDDMHVIGHSMGGQIAGFTGQQSQSKCNQKVGRITGLDPAGPLYQTLNPSRRLDKSDALFVDVIHTNQVGFGYYGTCGSVDFFPNCGTFQPGCLKIDLNSKLSDLINLPLSEVNCNHVRSIVYMIESISSNDFKATSCKTCPGAPVIGPCVPDVLLSSQAQMGEDCSSKTNHNKYFLITNRKSPYARG